MLAQSFFSENNQIFSINCGYKLVHRITNVNKRIYPTIIYSFTMIKYIYILISQKILITI